MLASKESRHNKNKKACCSPMRRPCRAVLCWASTSSSTKSQHTHLLLAARMTVRNNVACNTRRIKINAQLCSYQNWEFKHCNQQSQPVAGSTITAALQAPPALLFSAARSCALAIHCLANASSCAVIAWAAAVAAVTAVSSGLRQETGHSWVHSFHCSLLLGACLGTCRVIADC